MPSAASSLDTRPSSIDYAELGQRLRAYRVGASLQAEDVAGQLGISRAALYRLEQGRIVKIETLERLAQLLGTSLASLLGVEAEYYPTACGFLERMRQIESESTRIVAHFEPITQLLASDHYRRHLRLMLLESAPDTADHDREVEGIIDLLGERRAAFMARRPHLTCLIGLREIESFLQSGLIGRIDIGDDVRGERRLAARQEVEHIASMMESAPAHVRIGLIEDAMPATSFQLSYGARSTTLAVSPFRLGAMSTIHHGIATVTVASGPIQLYEAMTDRLWDNAIKGETGAMHLRKLLKHH